jgi:hypothetical protein
MRTFEFRGADGWVCCSSDDARNLCPDCKAKVRVAERTAAQAEIRASGGDEPPDPYRLAERRRPTLYTNGIPDGYSTALGVQLPTAVEIEWPVTFFEEDVPPDSYAPALAVRKATEGGRR